MFGSIRGHYHHYFLTAAETGASQQILNVILEEEEDGGGVGCSRNEVCEEQQLSSRGSVSGPCRRCCCRERGEVLGGVECSLPVRTCTSHYICWGWK